MKDPDNVKDNMSDFQVEHASHLEARPQDEKRLIVVVEVLLSLVLLGAQPRSCYYSPMLKTGWRLLLLVAFAITPSHVLGQVNRARTPIRVPDIPGYKTLKCDFHIHTVFSDGDVWPNVRAGEAWREGLDAIAITDHLEYVPHKADLAPKHGRSPEIAKTLGDAIGLTVIRGSEVTRSMPPGHLNAIFLTENEKLAVKEWRDALREARQQNAFIFWNHPGWKSQQPDGIARWYAEHSDLLDQGILHGIEVVNGNEYYPEVHRWCLEKNLTMMSNSDIHVPAGGEFDNGAHRRSMTLVFAASNGEAAIREALFARRTAVLFGNLLVGREEFIRPIFDASVSLLTRSVAIKGKGSAFAQISNNSDIEFELETTADFPEIGFPRRLVLYAGKTVLVPIRGKTAEASGRMTFKLPYTVKNVKLTPEQGLPVTFEIEVALTAVEN